MTTELLKVFENLSFKDKISVLNYALNIENPPSIVQSKPQQAGLVQQQPPQIVQNEPIPIQEVARCGQTENKTITKEYLDFIKANQETEDTGL